MAVPLKPGTSSPDFGKYFEQSSSVISTLLGHPLSEEVVADAFQMPTKMFFVDSEPFYFPLHKSIKLIHDQASALLHPTSQPARRELDKMRRGEPLSLFAIVRLHECFAALCAANAACTPTLKEAGLEGGFAPSSVIPSVLRFNRSRYGDILKDYGLSASAVPEALRQLKNDKGDVVRWKRNPEQIVRDLAKGYDGEGGKRVGAYRVTQQLADRIAAGLSAATDGAMSPENAFERQFDPNPRRGPGQGTMTVALPLDLGNEIKPVGV